MLRMILNDKYVCYVIKLPEYFYSSGAVPRIFVFPKTDSAPQGLTYRGRDKWKPFHRRYFQMYFLEWKCMNYD